MSPSSSAAANNIVSFPKTGKAVLSRKQKANNDKYIATQQIELTLDCIVEDVVCSLAENGVEIDQSIKGTKEFALCVESIKSMICSHYNFPYPMQKIAQRVFESRGNNKSVRMISDAKINRMFRAAKVKESVEK